MEASSALNELTTRISERVPISGLFSQSSRKMTNQTAGSVEGSSNASSKDNDRKDTHCFKCHRKGGDPLCQTCHRVYHSFCSVVCESCTITSSHSQTDDREKMGRIIELAIEELKSIPDVSKSQFERAALFYNPVDKNDYDDYYDIVVYPIDLTSIQLKAKRRQYVSFPSFMNDINQIYHNSVVYNSLGAWVTNVAAKLLRRVNSQWEEIEKCSSCFLRKNKGDPKWFVKPCKDTHILVWAKVRSYPFWPAKVMSAEPGRELVKVVFFGDHSRSTVKLKDCFLYGERLFPMSLINCKANYVAKAKEAMRELREHMLRLEDYLGRISLPTTKIPLDPSRKAEQLKLMFSQLKLQALDPSDDESEVLDKFKEEKSSSREQWKLKECCIRLERLPIRPMTPEADASVYDTDLTDTTDNVIVTNIRSMCEPFESLPEMVSASNDRSPSHSINNDVSSTCDAYERYPFNAELSLCSLILNGLVEKVHALSELNELPTARPEISENSTQTTGPPIPLLSVRKDLISEPVASSSRAPQTPPPVPISTVAMLNGFKPDDMASYIVQAFDSTDDNNELVRKILELNSKFVTAHAQQLQAEKFKLGLEMKALEERAKAAEALINRGEVNSRGRRERLFNHEPAPPAAANVVESNSFAPAGRLCPSNAAGPSRWNPPGSSWFKCNQCKQPADLICCDYGRYCSTSCRTHGSLQSNNWIRHKSLCQNKHIIAENIETLRLSADDSSMPRRARRKTSPTCAPARVPHQTERPAILDSSLNPANVGNPPESSASRTVAVRAGDSGSTVTMAMRKSFPNLESHIASRASKRPRLDPDT